MVSTVKVDVVAPRVATGTTTLGVSGDKLLIPSGVTLTNSGTASGFASGFDRYTVVTASDSTFDLQSTTTKLVIEVQASGGTAGSGNASGYNGGSGGGGAYARKLLTGITGSSDKLNITIGSVAGVAGSGTTTSVAQAGTASFTTNTCAGGSGGATAGGSSQGDGGAGGAVPTTGDFNVGGGNGAQGGVGLGNVSGGSWMSRGSQRMTSSGGVGVTSIGYGGGGNASYSGSHAGGDGGSAVVIVWEYKLWLVQLEQTR